MAVLDLIHTEALVFRNPDFYLVQKETWTNCLFCTIMTISSLFFCFWDVVRVQRRSEGTRESKENKSLVLKHKTDLMLEGQSEELKNSGMF